MEVVEVVFIPTNHFLVVASFLPTTDGPRSWSGQSARAHQRLKSQQSAVTAISTTISALNVSSDIRYNSHIRSSHAPRMIREDAKNKFYRTRHLRVSLVFNGADGPRLRVDGPSLVSDGALFSFGQSVVEV
jgi:hypothetical protein